MKKTISILFFVLISYISNGQITDAIKKDVENLASAEMNGRGYVKNGHKKAADYIAKRFAEIGLQSFEKNYFQYFELSANTFPKEPEIIFDDKTLICGQDYLINAHCKGFKGEFSWVKLDTSHINSKKLPEGFEGKWLVADAQFFHPFNNTPYEPELTNQFHKAAGFVILHKKLTYAVSTLADMSQPIIELKADVFWQNPPKLISVKFKNKFISKLKSQNVIGYIKGSKNPEKFLVFSAHYDHLGKIGKNTTFYGANDNAAGVALLFALANHYKENPPEYSIAFMAFGAEEMGLIGSRHYVFEPYFPLKNIIFLNNLDLVGTGADGLMAVNGSVFRTDFEKIVKINEEKKYFSKVQHRPKAANSDHYFFTEAGVPSFFIYLMGGTQAYHDVYDKAEQLPLSHTEALFKLLIEFSAQQ